MDVNLPLKLKQLELEYCTHGIKETDFLLNNNYILKEMYVTNGVDGQQVQIDNDIMEYITDYALNEHKKRLAERKLKVWEQIIGE